MKLNQIIKDLPINEYHGHQGTWSSSQLKEILESQESFIKKYITKETPREESEAFDTGTYFHTGILEPHKMKTEIVVFMGKVRHGNAWNAFKKTHKKKTIVTLKQKDEGDMMIESVRSSKVAKSYLKGDPEVSLFIKLRVVDGIIYAVDYKLALSRDGWIKVAKVPSGGFEIIVKVRADTLGSDFVSDLKSTQKNPMIEREIKNTVSDYGYDVSAALYLDMFSLVNSKVKKFVWIFSSKRFPCSKSWVADADNIMIGRIKYMKALNLMADLAADGWKISDTLGEVGPNYFEREWLIEKDTDCL